METNELRARLWKIETGIGMIMEKLGLLDEEGKPIQNEGYTEEEIEDLEERGKIPKQKRGVKVEKKDDKEY